MADLDSYKVAEVSSEKHIQDYLYSVAEQVVNNTTVCVYKSTDGHSYVGVLQDKSKGEIDVFLKLPDDTPSLGFSFDKLEFGNFSGIELTYTIENKDIVEFYCFSGSQILLFAKGHGDAIASDLNKDGNDELIVYNNGTPLLFFQQEDSIYCVDIAAKIEEQKPQSEFIRFMHPDSPNYCIPFYEEVISEKGSFQQTNFYYLYFYDNKLWAYKIS